MAQTINADDGVISGSAGLKSSSDGTAILSLQTKGTTALTVDGSQNVGIGTSSPAYKLQVETPSATGNIVGYFRQGSGAVAAILSTTDLVGFGNGATSGETRIYADGASGLVTFRTNGSTRATIDSSGNLGLGVTPSAWGGAYKGFQIGQGGLMSRTGGSDVYLLGNNYYDGTNFKYINTTFASRYQQDAGVHSWFTAASGTAGNTISFTQAMTLDASGNLGLGKTNPSYRLEVEINGTGPYIGRFYNASTSTTQYNVVRFGQGASGSAGGYIGTGGSAVGNAAFQNTFVVGTDTSNSLVFATNDTERARITAAGGFLVATTSTTYGSISAVSMFRSPTSGSAALAFTQFSGDVSTSALNIGKFDNDSTTSQIFIKFGINDAVNGSGQINANGSAQAAFGSFSDHRLKENIVDLGSQWESVKSLRPVEFDYIANEGGGHQLGFIAQEVQEVYPDLVGERADGMLTLSGMGKGEARLIKALQEAMARIEQLEAKVAALESN